MIYGWEGKHRFDVALAMHHRLQWFIYLWAQGLSQGDEYLACTSYGLWHRVPLPITCLISSYLQILRFSIYI